MKLRTVGASLALAGAAGTLYFGQTATSRILRDSHHVLSVVPRPRLYVAAAEIEGLQFSADGYAIFENVTKE